MTPDFRLGDTVRIACSGEEGTVIGRSVHIDTSPQCLVRYQDARGVGVENWWSDSALDLIETRAVPATDEVAKSCSDDTFAAEVNEAARRGLRLDVSFLG